MNDPTAALADTAKANSNRVSHLDDALREVDCIATEVP
jgi:hypothetical protein